MVNDKMVNIFDQVGKRTPFRTPDSFFEQSEQTLRAKIVNRKSSNRKLYWYYAMAASIVLVVGIFSVIRLVFPQPTQTPASEEPVYAQTEAPIYSSSSDWFDFAEADLFLDNMDW